MYQEYYGLTEKPFNLTPDPRFLYLSKKHKEAFAHLMYGIQSRSGFVMVSGEIGTGKTTICRSLLKQLDPSIEIALIFNPYLSPEELLKHINQDFGIESDTTSLLDLIAELNEYLLKSATEGKTCVLIIDEAQNLSAEILEQIRLLSNLETEKEKLIQIMLIGQPELAEKLELHELRQLNQRITARYHLEALTEDETLHYIAFRLRVAGGRKMVRFTRKAIREVYKISQGTPRVINAICDRALLIAFTMDTRELTPKIIKAAAHEIQGDGHIKRRQLNLMPMLKTAGVFSLAAVIVLIIILISSGPIHIGSSSTIATPAPTVDEPTAERFQGSEQQVEAIANVNEDNDLPQVDEMIEGVIPKEVPEGVGTTTEAAPEPAPVVKEKPESTPEVSAVEGVAEPQGPVTPEALVKMAAVPNTVTETPAPAVEEAIEEIKTEEAAPVTPEAPTFDRNALNTTLTSLLKRWNTNAASQKLNGSEVGDILAYGNAHGFSTTALRATPDKLLNINLPMLVQLNSEQGPVWAAWLNGDDTQATLSLHDRSTVTHSYEALNKLYAGNAVIFWRDPYAYQRALHEDEQGEPIWVIQHQLVSLGLRKKEPNGIYDTETFNTVKQIQFLSGLPIDGVLGSQTRMVLSSWLDKGNSPHLMEGLPASLPINPASEDTIEATMPSPEAPAVPAPTPSEPAIEVPIQDETIDEEPYTPLIVETPEVTQSTITEPARTLVPLRPITQDDDQTEGAQEKE